MTYDLRMQKTIMRARQQYNRCSSGMYLSSRPCRTAVPRNFPRISTTTLIGQATFLGMAGTSQQRQHSVSSPTTSPECWP